MFHNFLFKERCTSRIELTKYRKLDFAECAIILTYSGEFDAAQLPVLLLMQASPPA